MDSIVLFVTLLCSTSISAVYLVLHSMNTRYWVTNVTLVTLGFVWLFACRMTIVYIYQYNVYKYLVIVYWGIYFVEHFVETILWSTLASMVQIKQGKRINNKDNILETIIRLCIFVVIFCVLVILTLVLSDNIDKSVQVLRQVTFMMTVCSATMEFLFICTKNLLFEKESLDVFTTRQTVLLMLFPTILLFSSLLVCGIPKMQQECDCLYIECSYMSILSLFIGGIWYFIIKSNLKCNSPGSNGCPSQINEPITINNARGDIIGYTNSQKYPL